MTKEQEFFLKLPETYKINLQEIEQLLKEGNKLRAVKKIKNQTKWGLKVSKEFTDDFYNLHQLIIEKLCNCDEPGHKKFNNEKDIVCSKCHKVSKTI